MNSLKPNSVNLCALTAAPKYSEGKNGPCTSEPPKSERLSAQELTPEGLALMPHQVAAFEFARERLSRSKPSYLALDPGLGKTPLAAVLANAFYPFRVFYVCPPFLVQNTEREFRKWTFRKRLTLIPDSMIRKPECKAMQEAAAKFSKKSFLVVDEAHRFKNLSALRTKALLKLISKFEGRVVFMSGTPMPNSRPMELWPILRFCAPELFGTNMIHFAMKYCGAFRTPYGWEMKGFTNRKEFKARLTKSFMLRQKKELLSLPPKREGLLVVGDGEKPPTAIDSLERKILDKYKGEDIVQGDVLDFFGVEGNVHLATYLRLLGTFKLKHTAPIIESFLEDTHESYLIFGVHKDVIYGLAKKLSKWKPIVITGEVDKKKRQELVNEFQTNKERRVFIGNIQACGVGFTLTKATRVIFVEFSWVDGENTQASDRAHRIGQNESVLVQYVVLDGSLDHKRMEVLLKKRSLSL